MERGIFVPQGPHRGLQDLLAASGSVAAGPRLQGLAAWNLSSSTGIKLSPLREGEFISTGSLGKSP